MQFPLQISRSLREAETCWKDGIRISRISDVLKEL